jgi:NifU-like protein involved in Fe-S cluster formation
MPCSDSSSKLVLKLDLHERFISFEFAKITCGKEITAQTDYNSYCLGKTLHEILNISYREAVSQLKAKEEEAQFILHCEWEALRAAIIQYLGVHDEDIDNDRCRISSVEHTEKGVEIALVILPPKELPKILPCKSADNT